MPNALIHETSPYLLQHAHNPVAWQPWSDAAFAQARAENKLVFLSVGYSTCHWCHVMEHESFENPVVAGLMNQHFINIKVDREERPDLDAAYMAFVQASTGQGGWPMSVWLTPDGKPVVGGTYFPPVDSFGRPGFTRICQELANLWSHDRSRMESHASDLLEQLQRSADFSPHAGGLAGSHVFDAFLTTCQNSFDREWGGFGGAPKFPRPIVLRTLMRLLDRRGRDSEQGTAAWTMCKRTLDAMAQGGMHDHLGGGFHRYSVDRYWHVPHYEKMLYDQAQLAIAYLEAWQISHDPSFRRVANGIFAYLLGTLRDAGGAYHAAEDADSLPSPEATENREGAYWTWSAEEVVSLLGGPDGALVSAAFGIEAGGNARPESDPHGALAGQNTLFRALSDTELASRFELTHDTLQQRLAATTKKLLDVRSLRPPPHRDDKIITAWNGLVIAALARGAWVLGRDDLAAAADAAATFIRDRLWDGNSLFRSFRGRCGDVPGFPADYVFLIHGLIQLHMLFPSNNWLGWSHLLQQKLDADFWDDGRSGYVMRPALGGEVLLAIREDYDGAEPSPNHLAAQNLLQLAILLDMPHYHSRAEVLLGAGIRMLEAHPFAAPMLLAAADLHQRGVTHINIPPGTSSEVLERLRGCYRPEAVHTAHDGPCVTVCQGTTCRAFP